jgi:hypothetical protein
VLDKELPDGQVVEIELVIEPIPPETVDDIKRALEPLIRQSLETTGQADLLDNADITLDLERTFPADAAVTALFYLASGIALKTFEATLLPEIQRRFQARLKGRKRRSTKEPYRTRLRRLLAAHFDAEELRTLCFDLGIDYDDLRGEGKAGKARELITYLERRGRLDELLTIATQLRPQVDWENS